MEIKNVCNQNLSKVLYNKRPNRNLKDSNCSFVKHVSVFWIFIH